MDRGGAEGAGRHPSASLGITRVWPQASFPASLDPAGRYRPPVFFLLVVSPAFL